MATLLAPLIGERSDEVSRRLLDRFGTLSRIMDASPQALTEALGKDRLAAAAIGAARDLVSFASRETMIGQPVNVADRRLHDYLRCELVNPAEERMHAIYLDAERRYLANETVARGSRDRMVVPVRLIVTRALDIAAAGILMAHNHPSGSALPSDEDRRATDRMCGIAASLDIELVDHLIVSSRGIYSIKQEKLL